MPITFRVLPFVAVIVAQSLITNKKLNMENKVENKQLSRNDGNTVLCDVLSLEEAKHIAITEGKKIRHKYFLDSEYIYFDRGWKTEDGYDLPFAYFLSMDENWQTGWSEHIA